MTSEEEILYLKGQVAALSQLCALLLSTNTFSARISNLVTNRTERLLNRPDKSPNEESFARGYANILGYIESARAVVRDTDLLSPPG